jgi:GNAT superfamily N-acetyltransferase
MSAQPPARPGSSPLAVGERLGLIGLIDEGMRRQAVDSPLLADLFQNLNDLVNHTVRGAQIDQLKPDANRTGFHGIEVRAGDGQLLGRLNMLFLKKPLPCYYLVYVEVSAPFRNQGLGGRILNHYRRFLDEKNAIGLLDNIIPKDHPTADIYVKQGWRSVEDITGPCGFPDYLVHLPPRLWERYKHRGADGGKDIKELLLQLLHHLKRRRPAIDKMDNEQMVRQTIEEFSDLYAALETYFAAELESGASSPLMRYMFTRYVTKFLGFKRRLGRLVGFTGGQSLERIQLAPRVAALEALSYAPPELAGPVHFEAWDAAAASALPEEIKTDPARHVAELPNYRRPSLTVWRSRTGRADSDALTIGDLMDLGFDPTRLKEIELDGRPHIFERMAASWFDRLATIRQWLGRIKTDRPGAKVKNANLAVNPPVLALRDRGHAYVLRPKVPGIHWEEAVEQLELAAVNQAAKADRLIKSTVRAAYDQAAQCLDRQPGQVRDLLTCFVSWDLEQNRPQIVTDFAGSFLHGVYLA